MKPSGGSPTSSFGSTSTSRVKRDRKDDEESEVEEEQEVQGDKSDDEVSVGSKSKRKATDDSDEDDLDRLEDDDYDLLEENTGIRFKKKFRRVKILDDDDSDDDASTNAGAREQIAEELFDLDDDTEITSIPKPPAATPKAYSSEESSEDEIDDFIVDDSGAPIQRRKRRKGIFAGVPGSEATDEKLQSAQDIFGVDFEMEDLDGNVDEDDSEDEDARPRRSKLPKKPVTLKQIYEPAVLENMHYSDRDVCIRQKDIPERFQRQGFNVDLTKEQTGKNLIENEAAWIYEEMIRMNELQDAPLFFCNDDVETEPKENQTTNPGKEKEPEPDNLWQMAQSSVGVPAGRMTGTSEVGRNKSQAVAADDDDWETPSANPPKKGAAVAQANVDDDWDDNPKTVVKKPTDDDDEWDSTPAVPPKANNRNIGNVVSAQQGDEDEWGDSTPAPVISNKTSAVIEDEWDTDPVVAGVGANPIRTPATDKVPPTTPVPQRNKSATATNGWGVDDDGFSAISAGVLAGDICASTSTETVDDAVNNPPKKPAQAKTPEKLRDEAIKVISDILRLMKVDFEEVPYIAHYKKDTYEDKLLEKHLWHIYHLDLQYTKLFKSMKSLEALATATLTLLTDEKNKEWITNALGSSYREFTEEDVKFISECKSFEELSDYRSFYSLYYGTLTPIMKSLRRKQRLTSDKEGTEFDDDAINELNCSISQLDPSEGISQLTPLPANETLRVIRVSKYERISSELQELVKNTGITMSKLAVNITEEYCKFKKEPPTIGTREYAQLHLSTMLPSSTTSATSTTQIIEGMRTILATQLSREPSIKKLFRTYIFNPLTMGTLTVVPSDKGVKLIDEFHMLFPFKYVTNKKISDFTGDCFLKLLNGEQDKLINVEFSSEFIHRVKESVVKSWCLLYKEDGCSFVIQDWNQFRESVIEKAVVEILLPQFLKEIKSRLETEAKDFVANECRKQIRRIINVGKLNVKTHYESDHSSDIRVMAIAFEADPGLAPFACVMKSGGTELLDYCTLGNLVLCNKSNEALCSQVKTQIANFVLKNKPHFIVIGGESLDADKIADLVREAAASLSSQKAESDSESDLELEDLSFPEVQVEIIPNSVAKVYSLSKLATTEYGEYPIILRQAISLARGMLDPLVELGQLYNSDEDILCINFHPFQGKIDKQKLLQAIEEEFVSVINTVGLDFNDCLKDSRKGHMLQFICGLGPAKAAFLLRVFRRKTTCLLLNREQLHSIGKMETVCFMNCVGFIRINVRELENGSDDSFLEYLDSTRIHPSNYYLARFIAHNALASDDEELDENSAETEYVQKVLENPQQYEEDVRALEIDKYDEYLMSQDQNIKKPSVMKLLKDIVEELCAPFKDPRPDFTPPSLEESFYFLTKETPDTIYLGKLLNVKVVGFSKGKCEVESPEDIIGLICPTCQTEFPSDSDLLKHVANPKGIHVMLDNGIRGYMFSNMLSDQPDVLVKERVKPGQVVVCRICKLDPERRMVQLTSRSSDLRGDNEELKPPKDPAYDDFRAMEEEGSRAKPASAKTSGVMYQKRAITHICFHNITYLECKRQLDNMDQGEAIFRPSSKGSGHLTLSWKVMDGVFQHVDILERKQADRTIYIIDNEDYEDLDEILTRYVYPMASFVRDLYTYKYYVSESYNQQQLELLLREKYVQNPKQMPYIFTAIPERPGRFLLSYVIGGWITTRLYYRHEVIRIYPSGFYYRHVTLESLTKLLNYFKRHYKELPPTQTPMIGSATSTGSVQLF